VSVFGHGVVVKVVNGVLANVDLLSEDVGVHDTGGEFQVDVGDVAFAIAKGGQACCDGGVKFGAPQQRYDSILGGDKMYSAHP
jgi:hypothetical protein